MQKNCEQIYRKQTKIILGVCIFAIIIMAIGYANLTSTSLTITGSASSTAEQTNFKVYFTGANTVKTPNDNSVEVIVIAEETGAEVNFTGLKQKDVLAVFTKTGLYYIFNHGYNYTYTKDTSANLQDYNYYTCTWIFNSNN